MLRNADVQMRSARGLLRRRDDMHTTTQSVVQRDVGQV